MKTSTKKNVLKLATIAFLCFGINTIHAQIPTGYQVVDETVYQTQGKTFRLYVLPDAVYSPDYNVDGTLGSTARWGWTWTFSEGPDDSKAPANENWVEMINPAIGSYVFTVAESSTIIGCTGADRTKNVVVIAPPTATITTDDITDQCGDLAAQNIILSISENVPTNFAAYSFRISRLVETIDINGDQIDEISTGNLVEFPLAGKLNDSDTRFAWNAGGNHTFTIPSDALNIENSQRTRYIYTLEPVDGVTGSGIVSAISHKSDFIPGGVNAHAFGAKTQLVFVINPAPVTGPIYHIPNSFGL
jgi:hypothetical protein